MKNICHLADCMQFMKGLPDNAYSLCICDPPYGGNDAIFKKDCINKSKQAANRGNYKKWDNVAPDSSYFAELGRISKERVIWGINFFGHYNFGPGRICWDKKGTAFGRAELAYYSGSNSVNVCELVWNGMIQHDMTNKEKRIHPTQKPVALYKWLLQNYAKPGDTIFDSHVGSGSIRIACHDLDFEFEGCEIDADYHAAQEARYQKHCDQLRLF